MGRDRFVSLSTGVRFAISPLRIVLMMLHGQIMYSTAMAHLGLNKNGGVTLLATLGLLHSGILKQMKSSKLNRYAVKSMNRAVVLVANSDGYRAAMDLVINGITVVAIVDLRPERRGNDLTQAL